MSYCDDHIKVVTWNEVGDAVCEANPSLGSVINNFNPNNTYKFVKVLYQFGQSIMQDGRLHLPVSKDKTVPLTDPSIPKIIQQELGYRYIPMGVILKKKVEVFYESPNRVMPTKIFGSGSMIGLWESLDPEPTDFIRDVWNVSAGARSIFLLPKISNKAWHTHLKNKLNLCSYTPNSMLDHHGIFKEIAANVTNNKWCCEVLFLGVKWDSVKYNNHKKDLALYHHLVLESWRQSYNCRINMSYDMAWEQFTQSVSKRNIKPKPLIVNTLKHLIHIYDGFYPGFAPAIDNDSAPIGTIIDAYENIYKTNSTATVMEPVHLSQAKRPVYYSLQLPSLLENAPGTQAKNIIIDLRELQTIASMLDYKLDKNHEIFQFYHTVSDIKYNIHKSEVIFNLDNNFQKQVKYSKFEDYASKSPFLKGLIKICLPSDRPIPLPV